jgi:mono/diheme cytochrome c family protein
MTSKSRLIAAAMTLAPVMLAAQPPQQPPPGGGRGQGRGGAQGRGGPPEYPSRVVDPATAERGPALYGVHCAFCHGADTRGGDSGPSLLRSQLVQDDRNGETIAPVVRNGRPPRMPPFDLTEAQLTDIAAFLHSFTINSRDPARMRPPNILTGDAKAGQAYFAATCAACHAPDKDLKGLASRFDDPRALQQWWLLPGGGGRGRGPSTGSGQAGPAPVTATITLTSGQKYEGRLARIDEFVVSVVEADGTTRTVARNGDTPKVDVHDPLAPHKALLRVYTDKDIHDVTAYLVTLK